MNISLPAELERFVKEQVDTGRYQTASEVIREGLRVLSERHQLQSLIAEFDEKIREAEADVAAGRMLDPDQVRAMLREHRLSLTGARTA